MAEPLGEGMVEPLVEGMVEPIEETTQVPIEEIAEPTDQHSELVLPALPLPPTMCKLMLPTLI